MPTSSTQERDQRLLEKICEGDEAAFERLFLAYFEDLCRFASQYVSSPEVVEDLVQDIFFSVWRRRRKLDPGRSIRGYLYNATRNEALKHLKRKQRRPTAQQELQEHSPLGSPETMLRHKELETAVQKALDALPKRRRQIFLLSRRHGLTYAEIADLLDISVKTVETQIGRALRFLEEHLADVLPRPGVKKK